MQKSFSLILILLLALISCIYTSSSGKFFQNVCKSSRIPVKKVVGKHPDYISLAFTGDTQFARKIEKTMKKKYHSNYSSILAKIKPELDKNDALIFNLETVVSNELKQKNRWNISYYDIISKPKSLTAFSGLNTTLIANLANNHQFDGSLHGLHETVKNCYKHNIHPIGVSKFFGYRKNALPDDYEFPADFPKNIHKMTKEQIDSVPPLDGIIMPTAFILDVDGIKIGFTGVSNDFIKFQFDQNPDNYFARHKEFRKKYGCSFDIGVSEYQDLSNNTKNRYHRNKNIQGNAKSKDIGDHWLRRVLVELKRQGAQVFISTFHQKVEYLHWNQYKRCTFQNINFNLTNCFISKHQFRNMMDLGINAIMNSGPHVLYPFIKDHDTLLEYSLGNFIFDSLPYKYIYHTTQNDLLQRVWIGMVQEIKISKKTLQVSQVEVFPTLCAPFTNFQVLTLPTVQPNIKVRTVRGQWKFSPKPHKIGTVKWKYEINKKEKLQESFGIMEEYMNGYLSYYIKKNPRKLSPVPTFNYILKRCAMKTANLKKSKKLEMQLLKKHNRNKLRRHHHIKHKRSKRIHQYN